MKGGSLFYLKREGLISPDRPLAGETFSAFRQRCAATGYRAFVGNVCKKQHKGIRYCCDGKCVECVNLQMRRRWRDPIRGERLRRQNIEWRTKNKEQHLKNFRRWREKNVDHDRMKSLEWEKNNRGRCNAALAKRKARLLFATPVWSDDLAIRKIYEQCKNTSEKSGIRHEVDHIIPLQGNNVCGLHVAANLQIITEEDNRKKGNRFAEY